jgi:hypothetical protein
MYNYWRIPHIRAGLGSNLPRTIGETEMPNATETTTLQSGSVNDKRTACTDFARHAAPCAGGVLP